MILSNQCYNPSILFLSEIPNKFIRKCACRTSCGNRCACIRHKYICTEYWKHQNCKNMQLFLIYICEALRANFIFLILYFELIFIVFPVFFSPSFTEKFQKYELCHDDLAVCKERIQEDKWSSFGLAVKVRNYSFYVFFYYFRGSLQ